MKIKEKVLKKLPFDESEFEEETNDIIDLTLVEVGKVIDDEILRLDTKNFSGRGGRHKSHYFTIRKLKQLKQKLGIK